MFLISCFQYLFLFFQADSLTSQKASKKWPFAMPQKELTPTGKSFQNRQFLPKSKRSLLKIHFMHLNEVNVLNIYIYIYIYIYTETKQFKLREIRIGYHYGFQVNVCCMISQHNIGVLPWVKFISCSNFKLQKYFR